MTRPPYRRALALAAALCTLAAPALAHETEGVAGGFASGVLHPVLGPDHLVAMLAVGLWGAQLGMPMLVALPVAFPLVMALGGALGVLGLPLPAVEVAIAASALALGLAVAFAWRAPLWVSVAIVGAFAIFHGHAHGTELPDAAAPLAYGIGFVLATGMLHLAGIGIGALNGWDRTGPLLVRGVGSVIALAGVYFLVGTLA